LAKSLSHITQAYWHISGAEAASKQFRNYSQTYLTLKSKLLNVGKVLLLAKQTQVYAEKTRGSGIEVTQKYTEKPEMPPVTFVGNLCKINAVLFENCRCSWNRSA